jgi:putative ABC transport system ATP-binding protein
MLIVKNVSKIFPGPLEEVNAVRNISLSVSCGELVAVQGASGSGKTTLLLMAGTLLKPTCGTVLLDEFNPYTVPVKQRCRMRAKTIGFVFQQFHLVPYLSVHDNILAPSGAIDGPPSKDRVYELINHFKLEHRVHHRPSQLSTGERQRTALARAFLNRPKLLLADEPTGNLDDTNADIVLSHLHEFATEGGAVLLVSHDHRVTHYATRTLTIKRGILDAL